MSGAHLSTHCYNVALRSSSEYPGHYMDSMILYMSIPTSSWYYEPHFQSFPWMWLSYLLSTKNNYGPISTILTLLRFLDLSLSLLPWSSHEVQMRTWDYMVVADGSPYLVLFSRCGWINDPCGVTRPWWSVGLISWVRIWPQPHRAGGRGQLDRPDGWICRAEAPLLDDLQGRTEDTTRVGQYELSAKSITHQ